MRSDAAWHSGLLVVNMLTVLIAERHSALVVIMEQDCGHNDYCRLERSTHIAMGQLLECSMVELSMLSTHMQSYLDCIHTGPRSQLLVLVSQLTDLQKCIDTVTFQTV